MEHSNGRHQGFNELVNRIVETGSLSPEDQGMINRIVSSTALEMCDVLRMSTLIRLIADGAIRVE